MAEAPVTVARENRKLTRQLWVFVLGSFLFGFALVPLYSVLCDITGFGNSEKLLKASQRSGTVDASRSVTVEFISSMPTAGAWEFRPEQSSLKVHPGQLYEATFHAKNLVAQAVTAQAVPSIAPSEATQYFRKTDCFCFTPQKFAADQSRELTVRFFVDPSLPRHIDRVTLGYAMFTVPGEKVAQLSAGRRRTE